MLPWDWVGWGGAHRRSNAARNVSGYVVFVCVCVCVYIGFCCCFGGWFFLQYFQSLEFVAETRILAEMKTKLRGKKFSAEKQIDKHTFFLTVCRCSRKYGNHAVNECEFASKIEGWWSYCSWTFAYFKLFRWRKYMTGPDWSKKFVKPMNINFAFEAKRKLAIFTYGGFVNKVVVSKWLHGTEEECKRSRKQAPTRHKPFKKWHVGISESSTHGALLLKKFCTVFYPEWLLH